MDQSTHWLSDVQQVSGFPTGARALSNNDGMDERRRHRIEDVPRVRPSRRTGRDVRRPRELGSSLVAPS